LHLGLEVIDGSMDIVGGTGPVWIRPKGKPGAVRFTAMQPLPVNPEPYIELVPAPAATR